ncbi:TIGR00282 family metallophosphoesterase [Aerococcaceae bacterium WGS1372]
MKILFIGDIVGQSGQSAIKHHLTELKKEYRPQVTIANGENIADGRGITENLYKWLMSSGVDVVTLGNHAFDHRNIFSFIDDAKCLVRPVNMPEGTPGKGVHFVRINDTELAVINLLGNAFMKPSLDAFDYMSKLIEKVRARTNHIFIDFHAETTSEKQAMAFWLDGKISALVGTHTHVQTNDARLLPKGTAYQTDVGMTGALNSVIGFRKEDSIQRFRSQLPTRLEQETSNEAILCASIIETNPKTGLAQSIQSIYKKVR